MAVVKADGYGHDAKLVSEYAIKGGASQLGVATLNEGIKLRSSGVKKPILILGNLYTKRDLLICFKNDLMPTISSIRECLICNNIGKHFGFKFSMHLKVDTGMSRLGFESRIHQIIPNEVSLHAVGQGALGIECKSDDKKVLEIINILEDKPTSQRCLAERAFLRELEGGCQVPIGVNSKIQNEQLYLTGMVASLDGERLIKDQYIGNINDPEEIGKELAKKLKQQGAEEILSEIFEKFREK